MISNTSQLSDLAINDKKIATHFSADISTLMMAEQKLITTYKELVFQNEEKAKRAEELMNAKDKAQANDR